MGKTSFVMLEEKMVLLKKELTLMKENLFFPSYYLTITDRVLQKEEL